MERPLGIKTWSHSHKSIDLICKLIYCFLYDTRSPHKLFGNFNMEVIKTSQILFNLQKPLDILTIHMAKLNTALKMIRTPKSFHKLKHYGPFGNTLQHQKLHHIQAGPLARNVSQWIGFHTTRVLTERYVRRDNSIVITPTLLFRLYCWFSIILWCHNYLVSISFVCFYVSICL